VHDKLVRSQYGYHIILVTDRATAGTDPYEKVQSDIKGYLQNQKQLELIDNLTESLKKQAKIEYINSEYDPANVQKGVQESIKNSAELAKKAKENAEKNKK